MPSQFRDLIELSAPRAVDVVRVSGGDPDPEAVANGSRITSEVIYRTIGKLGIDLPEGFSEALSVEFDAVQEEERTAMVEHLARVQEMQATGP
jgi:hypothetical protein